MTASRDEEAYSRAMRRMVFCILALGIAGSLAAFAWRGWTWGAGFALGSTVSWLNFRWLKQTAEAVSAPRLRRRVAILAGLRYLILGLGACVILKFSPISLRAALAGLFVSVAAAIVVAFGELLYARN